MYRFVVTHTPSSAVNISGQDLVPYPSRFSFHMLDALAFFGGLGPILEEPLSANDTEFQRLFRNHLVNFAKTGRIAALIIIIIMMIHGIQSAFKGSHGHCVYG